MGWPSLSLAQSGILPRFLSISCWLRVVAAAPGLVGAAGAGRFVGAGGVGGSGVLVTVDSTDGVGRSCWLVEAGWLACLLTMIWGMVPKSIAGNTNLLPRPVSCRKRSIVNPRQPMILIGLTGVIPIVSSGHFHDQVNFPNRVRT